MLSVANIPIMLSVVMLSIVMLNVMLILGAFCIRRAGTEQV